MKDWQFLFEKFVLRQHRPYTEKKVMEKMREVHGKVFVDIGANLGVYSLALQHNFDKIYAFEPNEELFEKWPEMPANIVKMPYALSSRNRLGKLYLGTGIGSADTLLESFEYKPGVKATGTAPRTYHGEKSMDVQLRTFDSFMFGPVDLVKIDVEGAELQVLEGMANSLRQIRNIMIEVHNVDFEMDFKWTLEGRGFTVKKIDSHPHLFGSRK